MPIIQVFTGNQVKDGTIKRIDLNTTETGQAVITRVLPGTGIIFESSTGADPGTGDVTIGTGILEPPLITNSGDGMIVKLDITTNSLGFGACLALDQLSSTLVNATALIEDRVPVIGLALETGTGIKNVLLMGMIRNDLWSWNPYETLFLSTVTGEMTQTRPTGLGENIQELGFAISPTVVLFNPDKTYFKL